MLKIMIRGDLLIYTNNGIKRIDKLTKADYIYTNNKTFVEIDEINKINVKNYYLYKIKTFYNIDNYYLACLECNLKRRRRSDDKFLFTKQMKLVKLYGDS